MFVKAAAHDYPLPVGVLQDAVAQKKGGIKAMAKQWSTGSCNFGRSRGSEWDVKDRPARAQHKSERSFEGSFQEVVKLGLQEFYHGVLRHHDVAVLLLAFSYKRGDDVYCKDLHWFHAVSGITGNSPKDYS